MGPRIGTPDNQCNSAILDALAIRGIGSANLPLAASD